MHRRQPRLVVRPTVLRCILGAACVFACFAAFVGWVGRQGRQSVNAMKDAIRGADQVVLEWETVAAEGGAPVRHALRIPHPTAVEELSEAIALERWWWVPVKRPWIAGGSVRVVHGAQSFFVIHRGVLAEAFRPVDTSGLTPLRVGITTTDKVAELIRRYDAATPPANAPRTHPSRGHPPR